MLDEKILLNGNYQLSMTRGQMSSSREFLVDNQGRREKIGDIIRPQGREDCREVALAGSFFAQCSIFCMVIVIVGESPALLL